MKISFIFFRVLFHLICIYKVQANFWNYLNRLEKGFNLPGHVSHPESTREGGLGVGFRDTWRTHTASGGFYRLGHSGHVALLHGIRRVLSAWALGTRGTLA